MRPPRSRRVTALQAASGEPLHGDNPHTHSQVRGLARVLLNFTRTKIPGLCYSFGDKSNTKLPHITMPLWRSADQMVVTPDGQNPPELGRVISEDLVLGVGARARRLKGVTRHSWRTDATYTFSFNTQYLDLPLWKVGTRATRRATRCVTCRRGWPPLCDRRATCRHGESAALAAVVTTMWPPLDRRVTAASQTPRSRLAAASQPPRSRRTAAAQPPRNRLGRGRCAPCP